MIGSFLLPHHLQCVYGDFELSQHFERSIVSASVLPYGLLLDARSSVCRARKVGVQYAVHLLTADFGAARSLTTLFLPSYFLLIVEFSAREASGSNFRDGRRLCAYAVPLSRSG